MSALRQYLPFALIAVCLLVCCAVAWQLAKGGVAERKASLVNGIIDRTTDIQYDNIPYKDTVDLSNASGFAHSQPILQAYLLRQQGEFVAAVLLPVRTRGYHGDINIAIAIHGDGKVGGISVLSHQETSGIGEQAMQSAYTDMMLGESLESTPIAAWAVRTEGGDFDHVSGATISSAAIVQLVRDSLRLYVAEKNRLIAQP